MRGYLLTMFGGSLALTVAVEQAAVLLYFAAASGSRSRSGDGEPAASGRGEKGSFSRAAGSREGPDSSGRAAAGRAARILLLSVLVNVLTNPAAVLVCWLGRIYLPMWFKWPLELAVEALVVAVEGYVYFSFRKKPLWRTEHPILLSAWANGCSWLLGLWLSR